MRGERAKQELAKKERENTNNEIEIIDVSRCSSGQQAITYQLLLKDSCILIIRFVILSLFLQESARVLWSLSERQVDCLGTDH